MIISQRVSSLLIVVTLAVSLVITLLPMPATMSAARPAFYTMTVLFWTANQPQRFGPIAAWLAGIAIDVLYGTPFAEHGLAMAVAAYVVVKGRELLWSFPLIQQSLLMLPVFAVYEFMLFWIDGVAGLDVNQWWRWLPVFSSALLWPIWAFLLERIAELEVG
ncbi:rod shape-determining protein MreD [Salinisphaera hydrothermalis]|uniref:Rod shape-determining protein MreD n=1 Tax=Salinisphaera hydrothermalis (strain C41B8) TaxID=1304275 RepID=A0A084IL25_SALHC|nr:rod shape-determining protein MreD [Salinisphaera hydrothermalis]KEZ77409.1 rod shape-determining protein MreD [Salinisphaera hydrothermalis C41B8]